jgi:hypothetical protein
LKRRTARAFPLCGEGTGRLFFFLEGRNAMATGRTIYSERNNDNGERVVEVGKWSAVPTGPWCSWSAPDEDIYSKGYARDGKHSDWRTTPRGGDSTLVWWIVSVDKGRAYLRAEKWLRGKAYEQTTFASPEDLWSCAYQNAESLGRTKTYRFGTSWSAAGPALGAIDLPNQYEGYSLYKALLKRPMDEIQEIRAILVAAGADARAIELVDFAADTARNRATDRGQRAADTRAQTKAKADKGGNPKVIKPGDRLITRYTTTYSTGPQRFFWYTPSKGNPGGKCLFFTDINAEGYGVGNHYRVQKKYALRACIAAFEILNKDHPETPISLHQQMALLADQAAVEARRAASAIPIHQDTTPCTCDV